MRSAVQTVHNSSNSPPQQPMKTNEPTAAKEQIEADRLRMNELLEKWQMHILNTRNRKSKHRQPRKPSTDLASVVRRFGNICHWCKRECQNPDGGTTHPRRPTRDHLTPVCEGGKTVASNLVLACAACNSSRHAADWTPERALIIATSVEIRHEHRKNRK